MVFARAGGGGGWGQEVGVEQGGEDVVILRVPAQ